MILKDKNDRVILWGCEDVGGSIKVELAYFAPALTRKVIKVSSKKNEYQVSLPDNVLRKNFAGKAQNILLDIVS
ncbi:hypothetical protein [Myxosarcina sp. GI1(2024)]